MTHPVTFTLSGYFWSRDEFQVWNLSLDRTKSIAADWGSDQNKGKFISTALMERAPSFAGMTGTGWFFSGALEWGFAAPLLVRPVLPYSVTMSCSKTKVHWKPCPWDSHDPKSLYLVPLCSCLDRWLMSPCLPLCLKICIKPLLLLTQNKQMVY